MLTQKDVVFVWSQSCQDVFDTLKRALTEHQSWPTLTSLYRNFRLQTDTCVKGMGAVLAQLQADGQVHPVAYASRILSDSEESYAFTELQG